MDFAALPSCSLLERTAARCPLAAITSGGADILVPLRAHRHAHPQSFAWIVREIGLVVAALVAIAHVVTVDALFDAFVVARDATLAFDGTRAAVVVVAIVRTRVTLRGIVPDRAADDGASYKPGRTSDATVVLEPLLQIAASPTVRQIVVSHDATGKPVYLDEDSVALEFDESTLFQANKFPGYDLYEGGARFNVGARASYNLSGGRHASVLVGRVFRTEPNPSFTVQSGLRGTASDWMTALEVTPINGLSLFSRARLDANTFEVRREEAGFKSLPP